MPSKKTDVPALLFPMKIETRFIGNELWIRIFPDEMFLHSYQTRLNSNELVDAIWFKGLSSEGGDQRQAWDELVDKYGVYRASWLVHISNDELQQQEQQPPLKDDDDNSFYFAKLPHKLVLYLYPENEGKPIEIERNIIPEKLEAFGDGDQWVIDFDEAVKVGMAFIIREEELTIRSRNGGEKLITFFDRIIVVGLHTCDGIHNPNTAQALEELFKNHYYTEGMTFLPHGTPTNNLENIPSGYSSDEENDSLGSFDTVVKGNHWAEGADLSNRLTQSDTPAGYKLAEGLGLPPHFFKNVQDANFKESSLSDTIQSLSWFALGGRTLSMLLGEEVKNTTHQLIWDYYSKFVRAKGIFPAIRIGEQPYGILPITDIRNLLDAHYIDKAFKNKSKDPKPLIGIALSLLFEEWKKMVKNVPQLHNGNDLQTELQKVLSMQSASSSFQVRMQKYDTIIGNDSLSSQIPAKILDQLSGLSVGQIYKILQSYSPFIHYRFQDIKNQHKKLISLFKEFLDNDSSDLSTTLLHSPLLNFTARKAMPEKDLQLSIAIEDIQYVEAFIGFIKEDLDVLIGETDFNEKNDLIETQFKGETSLLSDLILKSYAHAIELFHQTVSFIPKDDHLIARIFTVSKIKKGLNENNKVSRGNIVIEIQVTTLGGINSSIIKVKTPMKGIVDKLHVAEGDEIKLGQPLFRVLDKPGVVEIMKKYITLGETFIQQWNNLSDENRKQEQINAVREVLDINSYRLDAWLTSLAVDRLIELRTQSEEDKNNSDKIHIGAYGWVENLRKDKRQKVRYEDGKYIDSSRNHEGGIIHCPSPAQSNTSAIFKNAFLSNINHEELGNPYTLNLTSDRIQKSQKLMQGIREDQPIEALLGYQLERLLHEEEVHHLIYILREKFPLEVNVTNRVEENDNIGFKQLSVINGLQLVKLYNEKLNEFRNILEPLDYPTQEEYQQSKTEDYQKLTDSVKKVLDTLDGSLDHLFYEAGYQLTQGNLTRSAAAMDASKGKNEPPETEGLKTQISGTSIQHKLIYLFPSSPDFHPIVECKAFINPIIEAWLYQILGPPSNIGCSLLITQNEKVIGLAVYLSDLDVTYSDLLYLSDDEVSDGASELELRIHNYARLMIPDLSEDATFKIQGGDYGQHHSLTYAIHVLKYALELLTQSQYIKVEDLKTESEKPVYDLDTIKNIRQNQIGELLNKLKEWGKHPNTYLGILSKFHLEEAKRAHLTQTDADSFLIKKEINEMILKVEEHLIAFDDFINEEEDTFYSAFGHLEKAAKAFFGDAFVLLPPTLFSPQCEAVLNANQQHLLVGKPKKSDGKIWGQERIQTWVQELAEVKKGATRFEEWQMAVQVWKDKFEAPHNQSYQIIQSPTFNSYPWVGLSEEEIAHLVFDKKGIYKGVPVYQSPETGESYPLPDGTFYPEGCESIVIYSDEPILLSIGDTRKPQYGIVVEAFTELIPNKNIETGVSFNYNAPNAEPPQTILLAMPSAHRDSNTWNEDMLQEMIYDTMDLMKIRMVDLEAMEKYGFLLPMTNWFNIPDVD